MGTASTLVYFASTKSSKILVLGSRAELQAQMLQPSVLCLLHSTPWPYALRLRLCLRNPEAFHFHAPWITPYKSVMIH